MPAESADYVGEQNAKAEQDRKEGMFRGGLPKHNWADVKNGHRGAGESPGSINRNRLAKKVGKSAGTTVRGLVGTAGFVVPHASTIATVGGLAAGTAVSATGVGLLAAAGAYALAQSTLAAHSLYLTIKHIDALIEIQKNPPDTATCTNAGTASPDLHTFHDFIVSHVLPYIIHQKREKAAKKSVGVVPTGNFFTNAYTLARSGIKRATGMKGVQRTFYANVLAEHLITCDCELAQLIVMALLFSEEDMEQVQLMDLAPAAAILMDKMRSF